MDGWQIVWLALLGYLVGAIPTGYLIGRYVKGVDLRTIGSGTTGATQVSRVLGGRWFVVTLLFDAAKAGAITYYAQSATSSHSWGMVVGLAALIGNCFSCFLRFRGGKGMATILGVLVVNQPAAALTALAMWVIFLCVTNYMSLASMSAAVVFAIVGVGYQVRIGHEMFLVAADVVIVMLLVYNHRCNIRRLVQGVEPPFRLGGRADDEHR